MKIKYDLHVHSALSPCADNDMTPVNVVAYAKLNGLDMVAISDHNAIGNVEVALKAGEAFGITVVPAIEVQTLEDIHILCLFKNYVSLKAFYETLTLPTIKNQKDIFGDQLVFDEDDNVISTYENLLLVSADVSSYDLPKLVKSMEGIAIPAHIDRDENGMLSILGVVEDVYDVVEFSLKANKEIIENYKKEYKILINSDAHTLFDIGKDNVIELRENSIEALFEYLRG